MRRQWAVVALLIAAVLLTFLAISYAVVTLTRSVQSESGSEVAQEAPPAEPEVAVPETRGVLVAARYLPVGTLLGEADMVTDNLEVGRIPASAVTGSDGEDLIGTAVRVPIDAGTPMLSTDLVHPGARGFLSLILAPGMRAVSVNVGPATRHAGLVDPGDRVDVVFTAGAPPTDDLVGDTPFPSTRGGDRLTRVLFEDVRVLAIDRTVRPPAVGGEAPEERSEFDTATLEVSPDQAPALIHADREGELALVARSAMPAPVPSPVPAAVHIQELLLPGAEQRVIPAKALPRVVQVFRAGSEEHLSFPEPGLPGEVIRTRVQPSPVPPSPAPSPPPEPPP